MCISVVEAKMRIPRRGRGRRPGAAGHGQVRSDGRCHPRGECRAVGLFVWQRAGVSRSLGGLLCALESLPVWNIGPGAPQVPQAPKPPVPLSPRSGESGLSWCGCAVARGRQAAPPGGRGRACPVRPRGAAMAERDGSGSAGRAAGGGKMSLHRYGTAAAAAARVSGALSRGSAGGSVPCALLPRG